MQLKKKKVIEKRIWKNLEVVGLTTGIRSRLFNYQVLSTCYIDTLTLKLILFKPTFFDF